MPKKLLLVILTCFLFIQNNYAQKPQKLSASEIFSQIQKLNFLGSVLYVAAHPDDENTRLIAYLANHTKAQSAYLSLTRGDGGQNLIGAELRELLGTIRTQELIEARKIDGGKQFFSRANDFGYSKTPDETLEIWDKEQVLSDVVWAIRKFKPDVIINRFDHRTSGTTHGHHTASAILSVASFDVANDATQFTNQLQFVQIWQPKRLFFNTSWWFYGSQEKFNQADKTNLMALQTGVYYPSAGKSNQEIAALSRSCHQSQGFGSSGNRGEETEYLEVIKGTIPQDKTNIFEGIDTSWNRLQGGNAIGKILLNVENNFDFKNPSSAISELTKAYVLIQNLEDKHWKSIKSDEIKSIIAACAGLYLEAVADRNETTPNSILKLRLETINRSATPMQLIDVTVLPESKTFVQNFTLLNNANKSIEFEIKVPKNTAYTDPYWLKEQGTDGMYRVENQAIIGTPDVIRDLKVIFNIEINQVAIPFEKTIIYKYNDEVKGEVYQPLDITPAITTTFLDKVKIFNSDESQKIAIKIIAGKDNVNGELKLEVAEDWKVTPKSIVFSIDKKNGEQTVYFEVTAPNNQSEIEAKAIVFVDGNRYDKEKTTINYSHISSQQVLKPSTAKFIKLNIKIKKQKIAYIMGAGDEVSFYLSQMGYEVTILKPEDITKENLANFDVVITGIRAYNTIDALAFKQNILFDFVKEGNTMIVQYNTTGKLVTTAIAPFPLKISHDRVTEENAEMRFIDAKNSVLNYPNKITAFDFKNWVQEQGLYYPDQWDKAFTPILSSNDKGENPKNGALLVAKYGKGHYIYTGLSFFRELPAGVSGAYRLMANLIAIGENK